MLGLFFAVFLATCYAVASHLNRGQWRRSEDGRLNPRAFIMFVSAPIMVPYVYIKAAIVIHRLRKEAKKDKT